jgi:hypothetical protein
MAASLVTKGIDDGAHIYGPGFADVCALVIVVVFVAFAAGVK